MIITLVKEPKGKPYVQRIEPSKAVDIMQYLIKGPFHPFPLWGTDDVVMLFNPRLNYPMIDQIGMKERFPQAKKENVHKSKFNFSIETPDIHEVPVFGNVVFVKLVQDGYGFHMESLVDEEFTQILDIFM